MLEIISQYIKYNCYENRNNIFKEIKTIGKIQGGYAFKSNDLLKEKTNYKVLKIKNITNNNIDINNTQYISNETANRIDDKFVIRSGNVIIAMTGAELGKTGYLYGNDSKYYLNQRVGLVKGINKVNELYLNCIFLQEEFKKLLNSKGYGSAQPNISSSDIESIEIPILNKEEILKFYNFIFPLYKKIVLNSESNQTLIQLRDTLLPKLMNGEIDLENIEI